MIRTYYGMIFYGTLPNYIPKSIQQNLLLTSIWRPKANVHATRSIVVRSPPGVFSFLTSDRSPYLLVNMSINKKIIKKLNANNEPTYNFSYSWSRYISSLSVSSSLYSEGLGANSSSLSVSSSLYSDGLGANSSLIWNCCFGCKFFKVQSSSAKCNAFALV